MPDKDKYKEEVTDPSLLAELNSGAGDSIVDQVKDALKDLPFNKREMVLSQARHETGKPNLDSHVAKINNNVTGITWNENFPEEWKGSARPSSEGGYYVHFPSIGDWAKTHMEIINRDKGHGSPLDADSIEEFAKRLKKNGYYKAPESQYIAGMKNMADQYGEEREEVTDPSVLAALNGEDIQKKSPVESSPASDESSQPGPTGVSQQPAQTWNNPQAEISGGNTSGISVGVGGQVPQGPVLKKLPQAKTLEDVKVETNNAHNYLAQDVMANAQEIPEYAQNINSISFSQPGNIVHDITDSHGNPELTAAYMNHRVAAMNRDYRNQLMSERDALMNDPNADPQALGKATADHLQNLQLMKNSASHIMDLQMGNKALTSNNFDPVALGIEKQKYSGDQKADRDQISYRNGKPLNPHDKMVYQTIGLGIMQNAKQNALANGQQAVADIFGEHSDNPEFRLEKDNPEVFKQERIRQIANDIYKHENPLYGSVFSREESDMTPELIAASAKRLGMSKKDIEDIKPADIPRSSSFIGQALQGFTNTIGAPLYETGMRALAKVGIADENAVNNRFHQGWEEENSFGHLFTGEMPEAQKELKIGNVRGVLGTMAKGVGDLGGFLLGGELGSAFLKDAGVVKSLQEGHKLSNFAMAAIPAYNSAYEKSMQVIGDNEKDEWKRQIYSITNGVIGGALMNIDPKADIARDIIGETKTGTNFVNMLKNGGIEDLTKNEFQSKAAKIIQETAKHLGLQIGIPVAQTAAGNLSDMIFDPEHPHGLMDNTEQAAISGGVAMFLPSLFAGLNAPSNQTALNKSILWEVGTKPTKYFQEAKDAYQRGDMSQSEFKTAVDGIYKAYGIIGGQVPADNVITGKKLTPQQQQDYAWNLLRNTDLNTKLQQLQDSETPDKSQVGLVTERLNELAKERTDILNNAGNPPKSAKPVPPKEKNKEKLAQSEEKNIPLNPQNTVQGSPKNVNENESISRQEGRQNSSIDSEGQEQRQDASIQGATELEGRQEPEENRELKPTNESTNKAGEETPALSVSRKRRKLVVDEEESVPVEHKVEPDLHAVKMGSLDGKPVEEAEPILRKTGLDEKIGGTGETPREAIDRVRKAWEKFKETTPDNTLTIQHSGVMKIIEAGEKHGWDNHEKIWQDYLDSKDPEAGEIRKYQGKNGEITVTRHAESKDGADGLMRREDTPLTKEGQREAAEDIPAALEKEGVKPSVIVSDDQQRTHHTAEIVQENLKPKSEFLPPQPSKSLHEMSTQELNDYHEQLKAHNKELDKKILGDRYDEYQKAHKVVNSSYSSEEATKKASATIDEIEASLSQEQRDALYGQNLPEGYIANEDDVKDYLMAADAIENDSPDETELGHNISNALITLNSAPEDVSKMSPKQKQAVLQMRVAKKIIEERGYDGARVTSEALKKAASKFPDAEDAEFMLSRYLDIANKKSKENASTQSKEQQQKSIEQGSEPEHARAQQTGSEEAKPSAESGDSNQRSQGRQEKVTEVTQHGSKVYVTPSESVKEGSIISFEKGGRIRTGIVESEVKRHTNKDLVGMYRVKELTNAHKHNFQEYNAKKAAVQRMEPQSLEEAVLQFLLGDGKFVRGTKDKPGIERHLTTRSGKSERADAEKAWTVERGSKQHDEAKRNKNVRNADSFESWLDEDHIGNIEGEVGEILSNYRTKSEVLDRLHDIMEERQKQEEAMEGRRPEDNTYTVEYVHPETGEKEYVEFDGNDPDLDHKLAQFWGVNDKDAPVAFTEEGHPIYEQGLKNEEAISDIQMSDEEMKGIDEILAKHTDDNGNVDFGSFSGELSKYAFENENVSNALKDIISKMPFLGTEEENAKFVNELTEKIKQYEQGKQANDQQREAVAASEGAKNKGGTESPQQPPDGEADKPTAKERPVKSFETSQGSKYEVLPDGRTQRTKTATGEKLEPQDHTVFVKFKDEEQKQRFLRGVQDQEGSGAKVSLIGKGDERKVVLVDNKTGKVLEEVETTTTPTEGYNVFDQRRFTENGVDRRESHIGNEVTKINYAEPGAKKPEPKPLSLDEQIKVARKAHQQLVEKGKQAEKDRQAAIKSGGKEAIAEATQKVNNLKDLILKKEKSIDKLVDQQKDEAILKEKNDLADSIEDWYKQKKEAAKERKERRKGDVQAGIGLPPSIAEHISDFVMSRVVEGVRQIGSLEVAIRRAIRLAKEKFGDEAKELNYGHAWDIREATKDLKTHQKQEPVLPIDHEEYAKDILADILDGKISHEAAIKEVMDEVIENRAGQPVSEHVAENAKAKILNYIDWHVENDVTSIKNTTTRIRREQFSLNEEIPTARKEFGQTWDEAKEKIANGYDPLNLIEELSHKARPLTDVENAILLHHQNAKEIEFNNINERINKAAEEGNEADIVEHKATKARLLDELQKIYDINKAVGTENARGLSSRQMMTDRKYSLVNMISEKRATANDGKPLSDAQQAEIENLHQKIKETQQAYDDYVKKSESQIIDLQRKALSGSLKEKGKKVADKLRAFADKIEKSSKNQAYSSPIPITPKMVAEAIRLVANGIEGGGKLLDHVKNAIEKIAKDNPGIDETHLEKEINKELIDAGILDVTPERRKAKEAWDVFSNGKPDREAIRLKVEADRAKAQFDIQLKRDEESKLSKISKAQNMFIKWQRMFKLSNPITIGKLFNAGFTRLVTTPLEDIVGGAYSALLPQLAKGAIGEGGGLNVSETANAYKNGILLGMKDAKEIMSKKSQGKSELDVLFGKAGELPPEAIDFFGQLHSATKAPFKRAIFERSLERRLRRSLAVGVDITDPMVQTSIMMDAYKDANRAIFMQDNKAAALFQRGVRFLETPDKTGKTPYRGWATAARFLLPFVKVPTNIAAEVGAHTYGVPLAAIKLIHAAFTGGIENLPPEEKEIIMRNLKKGSLGMAALALGFFNPQTFGGYFQPGKKRNEDDAEAMGFKLFGEKFPAWLIEAPIFQAMQLGATVRRIKDEKVKGVEKGIGEGVWAGLSGLAMSVPLANQPVRIGKIFTNPKDRDYYVGELAKSTVDPAIITYLAKVTDPADDEGSLLRQLAYPENKRATPKTIMEHIKSGLPYFREDLEEKKSHSKINNQKYY